MGSGEKKIKEKRMEGEGHIVGRVGLNLQLYISVCMCDPPTTFKPLLDDFVSLILQYCSGNTELYLKRKNRGKCVSVCVREEVMCI